MIVIVYMFKRVNP